jgi:hypothetical protein
MLKRIPSDGRYKLTHLGALLSCGSQSCSNQATSGRTHVKEQRVYYKYVDIPRLIRRIQLLIADDAFYFLVGFLPINAAKPSTEFLNSASNAEYLTSRAVALGF